MNILESLQEILDKTQIYIDEPMSKHTTFQAGGKAKYFVLPETIEQLSDVIMLCYTTKLPFAVIGRGSNLLVSDKGYDGVIISMTKGFLGLKVENETIHVDGGVMLEKVSNAAIENALTGLEFAYGIPGTIGGAIVMNAGAYDGEMSKIVKEVVVLDHQNIVRTLKKEELDFDYRHSCIKKERMIVLRAILQLEKGNQEVIRTKTMQFMQMRTDMQPLTYPSAGSTFKRPQNHFAGKLIMEASLAGKQIGGAQVSTKHCGFIINKDHATASDIYALIQYVIEKVFENANVRLEPEVQFLGDFT